MTLHRSTVPCLAALLLVAPGAPAAAQRRSAPQEFVRQIIVVANFEGANRRLGREAGDAVRDRVDNGVSHRQLEVVPGDLMREKFVRAGYAGDTTFGIGQMQALARQLRADEYIVGRVERADRRYTLEGRLILVRDLHVSVPIGPVSADNLDRAADAFAAVVQRERRQLPYLRRCENEAREGNYPAAVRQATDAVDAAPPATLARMCRMRVHLATQADAHLVLDDANAILERDSTNPYALEGAARGYDGIGRDAEGTALWVRLAHFASDSLELQEYVLQQLIRKGRTRAARDVAVEATTRWPDHMGLLRLRWQAHFGNREWADAIAAGERLLREDDVAQHDSAFHARLVVAYRANNQPVRALEVASRGVTAFPGDPSLFVLYAQLVRAEALTVVDRGVEAFPGTAEFLAMRAQDLRTKGRSREALDATVLALQIDSTMVRGFLQLAQAYWDVGLPDSTFTSLRRSLAAGEDSSLVAQYALARGSEIYRTAASTNDVDKLSRALGFFTLADSAAHSSETSLFAGVTAATLARLHVTEAGRSRTCDPAIRATTLIAVARAQLAATTAGTEAGVPQQIEYLAALEPVAARARELFCTAGGGAAAVPDAPGARRPPATDPSH